MEAEVEEDTAVGTVEDKAEDKEEDMEADTAVDNQQEEAGEADLYKTFIVICSLWGIISHLITLSSSRCSNHFIRHPFRCLVMILKF
jgi:hypothetical protein